MSSYEASEYDYDDSYDDDYSIEDLYAASKSDFSKRLRAGLEEVIGKSHCLIQEYQSDIAANLSDLTRQVDNVLNSYTLDVYSSPSNQSFINEAESSFNSKAINLRHKIELLKAEQLETQRRIEETISSANNVLVDVNSSDALVTYKNDFASLSEEFHKAKSVSSIRRKLSLLNAINNKLSKLNELHTFSKGVNIQGVDEDKINIKTKKHAAEQDIIRFREEISKFYSYLKNIDENASHGYKSMVEESCTERSIQRLSIVKDQIKLTYGKLKEEVAWSQVYKDLLNDTIKKHSIQSIPKELLQEIDNMLSKTYIKKKEFSQLSSRINHIIADVEKNEHLKLKKEKFIGNVRKNLLKLGYAVVSDDGKSDLIKNAKKDELIYFDTKWDGYKVMAKMSASGELITRIVKVVSTDSEKQKITDYQKQKDIDIARQWCGDYDRFLAEMKARGINMRVKVRKEPDQEPVVYIVDKHLARTKSQATMQDANSEQNEMTSRSQK